MLQLNAFATNYYISSTGTNTNPTTTSSSNPLAFTSFSSIALNAGDTVFFKRGDIFRGQINIGASGTTSNPIVFTAYGTGATPIISGSEIITNFTIANNAIFPTSKVYKTFYNTNNIKNLFVNGVQMTIAQTPNVGAATQFETVNSNSGVSKTGFKSSFSNVGTTINWAGAKVCVRTSLWTWETRTVENMIGTDSINYPSAPTNQPTGGMAGSQGFGGYGFILFNKKELIDAPGEWFYNGTDTLYYYPVNNASPSSQTIDASVYKFGIYSQSRSNITISNLAFQYQDSAAIFFVGKNNNNIVIQNCTFNNQNIFGIKISGTNNLITQNTFRDCNGRSLDFDSCVNTIASYNSFKRNGMFRNYGVMGDEDNLTAFASFKSNNVYIHHNVFDSTGYCGLRCDGDNTTNTTIVEKNILSNCMMLTTDGAPLKTYGSFSKAIYYRNNFISNYEGNNAGAPANTSFHTAGIYFDVYASNCKIENNTIEQSNSTSSITNGIYSNADRNMTIKRNIVFGGVNEGIFINDRLSAPNQTSGDSIYYNIIFGKGPKSVSIRETSANTTDVTQMNLGKYDSNYYYTPYSSTTTKVTRAAGDPKGTGTSGNYSLTDWRTLTGNDTKTKENSFIWASGIDSSYLFKNPTDRDSTINLNNSIYTDLDGNIVQNNFVLSAWTSRVLIKTTTAVTAVVNPVSSAHYSVFPNPAIDKLYIDLAGEKNINYILIASIDGKILKTMTVSATMLSSASPISIDVSNYSKGLYIIATSKAATKFTKL